MMKDQLHPFDAWVRFGFRPTLQMGELVAELALREPAPIQPREPHSPAPADQQALRQHVDEVALALRQELSFMRDRMTSLESVYRPLVENQQGLISQLGHLQQQMQGLAQSVRQMLETFRKKVDDLPVDRVTENSRLLGQLSQALGTCVSRLDLQATQILFLIWKQRLAEYHVIEAKGQAVSVEEMGQARQNVEHYAKLAREQSERLNPAPR